VTVESRAFEDVRVGEELPELRVDVTPTVVIGGAFASRDLTPVHHDRAAARKQGLQDVIMNTLTTNGFVGRYATDWSGPDGVLKAIRLKLGAPNLAGDVMKLTGQVEAVDEEKGEVELRIVGSNSWGEHVSASVRLELPRRG
jgi:acyl dehydratase